MADSDYSSGVVIEQGGQLLRVKNGSKIVLDSGGTLDVSAGTFTGGGTLTTEFSSGETLKIDNGAVLDASAANASDVKLPAGAVITAALNAGAVTPTKMAFTGIKVLAIVGYNGIHACTATGAAVGDRLVAIFGTPTAGGALIPKVPGTDFEATVSVTSQLQQLVATDLSGDTFIGIFIPAAA
jgi:hypothetical protein